MANKHFFNLAKYYIALKTFIRKRNKILVCKDIAQKWDLPGGRIKKDEFKTPLDKSLKREIKEEIGKNVKYKNNGVVCLFRARRKEITAKNNPKINIFMIGFELKYIGGEIVLSNEHNECRWIALNKAAEYLEGGQLQGFKKYLEYIKSGKKRIVY